LTKLGITTLKKLFEGKLASLNPQEVEVFSSPEPSSWEEEGDANQL
jgi:hypothetical protein